MDSNSTPVGWALPTVNRLIWLFLVGNAHPTIRKFCNVRLKILTIPNTVLQCLTEEKMKPTVTVRLPEEMRSTLKQISCAEQKPVSDIVRESIRRYISVYQFRRLSNKVLPFAEAQGLLTDEDVFKALK